SSRSGNLTQLLSDLAVEVFPRDTRVCFFGSPQPCVVIQRQHGSLHLGAGSATRNAGKRIALDFYRSAFTGFHDDAAIIAAVDIRGCVIVSNPGIDILGFYSVGNRMPDWCFTRGERSSAQTEAHHPEKIPPGMARILLRRGREFVLRMLHEGRIVPQLFKTLPVNLFCLFHMMTKYPPRARRSNSLIMAFAAVQPTIVHHFHGALRRLTMQFYQAVVVGITPGVEFSGAMAVNTPAHSEEGVLADDIHGFDRTVTSLTLHATN